MAENFNTNLPNVAACYVKILKVPVTITSLRQSLIENPYYPSLFSLSNTFERFNIPYDAFKADEENFEKLDPPFIAYLKNQATGKDFVLVTRITDNQISYIAESKKTKTINRKNFLKDWEKIVLKAEVDDKSGEKDFQLNHKKEIVQSNKTYSLIAVSVFIFLSTAYLFLNSLPHTFIINASALFFIKLLGLSVTMLLLIYEIDKSNSFVKSICSAGKQTSCNAVLQSNASKIFGMTWSEAGFFYFASTFLFLFFHSIPFANKISVLSIANCIAAPYILFSVYYQWKVVKQCCPLCLIVQAALLLELILSITNFWLRLPIVSLPIAYYLLPIAYCLSLLIVLWYSLKPLLLKAKDEPVYKAAYKRLLYNPETFNHLLQQQPAAPNGYQNIGITMGNFDAANTIIKVCNPYCGPCAKMHKPLHEIVQNNKNVKLKLIFTASNDANDKRGIAAKHLLAINEKQNDLQIQQALDDWYLADKKDYGAFATKYPMNGELSRQEKQIEDMSVWCKKAGITATPTLFINGHRLPDNYNINELKYIL